MPTVEFSLWRFQNRKSDGVQVGHAVRTEVTGKEAWRRACLDISNIIAADCRRNGNPDNYGIAMTFFTTNVSIPQTASEMPGDDENIEILPEKPAETTPAPRNGTSKRKRK